MIYKRIIKFNNNSYLLLDNNNILNVDLENHNILNNIDKLLCTGNDFTFYGSIIDFLVLYNYNKCLKYNYFVINDLNLKIIIFNKQLIDDFLLKYVNISKNRSFFSKILLSDINSYYINKKFNFINEDFIDEIDLIIKNKLSSNDIVVFSTIDKRNTIKRLSHSISRDKHLLKFDCKYLYKKKIEIKIGNISKLIGDFEFINYIYHYTLNKNNVDIFLLNSLNINGLNTKPLIVKGMDTNSNLSIIKGFAEGIERYSSMQLINDKLLYTSKIDVIKIFSRDFLGYEINENEYKKNNNGFNVSRIRKIENSKITLDKSSNIVVPIDFVLFSKDNKSVLNYIGNSNGISTHTNYYDAFLNSYYEIIERDSIILTYFYKLTPHLIKLDKYIYKEQISILEEKYNYTFSFFNLNYDYGVNIVLCIGKNKINKIPYIFSGAGADLNFIIAFKKALNEVLYLIDISKKNNYEKIVKNEEKRLKKLNIFDTKDHIYYYSLLDSFKDIEFLFLDKKSINFSEVINFKKNDLIKKINLENLYLSNLTTTFGKKNNFLTIKLFTDNYIPMWFGKQSHLPVKKIEKRFCRLKEYLVNKKIFNKAIYNKYFDKKKAFLHFLG